MSSSNRHNVERYVAAGLLALLSLGLVVSIASTVSADFTLAHWQFYKPVTVPPTVENGQLVELTLDREVFLGSNLGETDLRLVAGRDQEVPYQLVTLEESERRSPVSVTVRDRGHIEGEYSTLVADVGESGNLHSEVVIDTTEQNFRRTVIVETGTDGETWAVARDDGEIYGFVSADGGFRVHHTSVRYPQSAARYLRVKVLDEGNPPLQLNGATVFLAENVAARESRYLPASTGVSRDESGTSHHLLDLGDSGVPVSRLTLQSDSANFYRGAGILGSDDEKAWEWLGGTGGDQLYSLDTPRFTGSRLELEFQESRYRYYRLEIDDADNEPLLLKGYTFHGADRLIRFQAEPGREYALYYGNPVAEAPVYDLRQVVPYLDTENLPVATLGSQQPNEAFSGLDVPVTERLPWLLPTGVALAALVVAALLYGVVKQARKVLPPPGEESAS